MTALRLLLVVVACWTISVSCFAKKHIRLKANTDRTERSIEFSPVEAWVEDNNKDISLYFYKNISSINVFITTFTGEFIYSECIETKDGYTHLINLDDISEGVYVLSIYGDSGNLYGEFAID